ncbi:hypothetical protein BT96DRAFT_1077183, partial [Gymnopus androsaceus JB14]
MDLSERDLGERVSNVADCFAYNEISLLLYIQQLIFLSCTHSALLISRAHEELHSNAWAICQCLFSILENQTSLLTWAFGCVKKALCSEVVLLTLPKTGLNFNTKNASLDFVSGSFMEEAASIMSTKAPRLWWLVHGLLDARQNENTDIHMDKVDEDQEPLDDTVELGEIGGDCSNDSIDNEQNISKSQRHALARKAALITIKSIVLISIIAHSSNQRCNYLQSILGIFFHSLSVPEKVIEVLSHAGISIALSTIHNAVTSLSAKSALLVRDVVQTLTAMFAYDNFDIKFKTAQPTAEHPSIFVSATSATTIPGFGITDANRDALRWSDAYWDQSPLNPSPSTHPLIFTQNDLNLLKEFIGPDTQKVPGVRLSCQQRRWAWHTRKTLVHNVEGFKSFSTKLSQPEEILLIPLHKTQQIPCRAMKYKESTNDGNVQVVDDLHCQGGIGQAEEKG